MRRNHDGWRLIGAGVASLATLLAPPPRAQACGCFAPPAVTEGQYAVAQQAETIIFEVEPGYVTAHVLIRYTGAPETFAWIVPVPSAPELSLSETVAFGVIEQATRPSTRVDATNLCPDPEWECRYHPPPACPRPPARDSGLGWGGWSDAGAASDSGPFPADGSPGYGAPPVEVISREVIGSYDTIVFAAGDAAAAVEWLRAEGFLVNRTMSPYLQPYADDGKIFVASRLVPGAGVDEIRPLKMRYAADRPCVPLRLTAVAADPHLTVTALIYGAVSYEPVGHEIVPLPVADLATDAGGRINYPMLLARAADDAGGDGFVLEYSGSPVEPRFMDPSGCCEDRGGDFCGLAYDAVCSCPGNPYDEMDCARSPGVLEGYAMVRDLAARHRYLTRLTTRISPEEMTFDPEFGPTAVPPALFGPASFAGRMANLDACRGDVIEDAEYEAIERERRCATVYCDTGECAISDTGAPGCICDSASVGRAFDDLDGGRSITCVPVNAPVSFRAEGEMLPDACAGVDCGAGTCLDINGFATCRCEADAVAVLGPGGAAWCARGIVLRTGSPGARDVSDRLRDVRVCAPRPPVCGPTGWLVPNPYASRHGETCASSTPTAEQLRVKPRPTCPPLPSEPGSPPIDPGDRPGAGTGVFGGCAIGRSRAAVPWLTLAIAGAALWSLARRRRR